MKPFIKVCGIQTKDEALGAYNAGATALGFLVGLTHKAEDKITAEKAREIIQSLPPELNTVMVTHLLNAEKIAETASFLNVKTVQIHDSLPISGMIHLREIARDRILIKAVHVIDETALKDAKLYETCADMLLLDSHTKDRLGGTGRTHDWNISALIVKEVNLPVILAGGLNPQNIRESIEKVCPAGIDANSGLEHPDGTKDFDKIRIFAKIGRELII